MLAESQSMMMKETGGKTGRLLNHLQSSWGMAINNHSQRQFHNVCMGICWEDQAAMIFPSTLEKIETISIPIVFVSQMRERWLIEVRAKVSPP